jgi:hypothetical protein
VKLLSVAGEHAMLVLANGYGRAIAYRARITTRGQTRPTDVCIVIPNRHGFEYWPFRIDRLEISDMRFVAWKEGESAPCA